MPFLAGRGQSSRGYFGGGTTPDAPTSLVSTKGNGQISVAFSAPAFNGGLEITTYQYALSTDSYATWTTRATGTTASPLVITGLSNGTSYGVKLRAVNALGAGTASSAATAVTPSTVPNAPTGVSGTANGVTSSTVSWTAPANTGSPLPDGGSAITGYNVAYAPSPYTDYVVFNADTGNTNTSILVTGLTNGGSYKFKITAKNENGYGDTAGESGVVVTNIVPAAPTIGAMTHGTEDSVTEDTLAWTAPTANGGSAITGYVYQTTTNDGSTFAGAVSTGSTAVYKTFDPGYTSTTTKVRVAAVNSLGTGPYSEISAVGYGGWTSQSGAVPCSCANDTACPCSCGTATYSGDTSSKTCYRWTRDNFTTGYSYNSNSTDACTAACSACTGGSCSGCSGSWTPTTYTNSFVYDGNTYTKFAETNSAGNGTGNFYYYISQAVDQYFGCGCYEHISYTAEYCYVDDKYRATYTGGCKYYRSTSSCGGGGS